MSWAALDAPRPPVLPAAPADESPLPPRAAASTRVRGALERPVVACLVLLLAYASLSMFVEPGGFVAADTGGKVATVHVMADRGTLNPGIGYWAEAFDPTGSLHPLRYTAKVGDEWVQVTTLPMVVVAVPLYDLGGDRAILVLPMLGAVMCALAARALARRLGAGTGWAAFWVVGLATPVTIYALSFWEHTLGLAAMLWAVVFLLDVVRGRAGWRGATVVGLLFGAAATMRTEALVYFVVAVAGMGVAIAIQERKWTRAFRSCIAAGLGAVAALVAEYALEVVLIGRGLRGGRVASTAAGAGASLLDRFEGAGTTLLGLDGFKDPIDWFVGGLIVAVLVGGAWCLSRGAARRPLGLSLVAIALLLYVMRAGAGLGFVPGLLTASPIAAVGAFAIWTRRDARLLALVAWCALPIVWLSQYSGGARPQWGGRYLLLSGALFTVAAVVVLARHRIALAAIVACSVAVTAFGFVYLAERSESVAAGMDSVMDRGQIRFVGSEVISLDPHLFREGGAAYDANARWLTATDDQEVARAVRVMRDARVRAFTILVPEGQREPRVDGYVPGDVVRSFRVRPDLTVRAIKYHAP